LIAIIVGAGVLTLPYVYSKVGFILGSIILGIGIIASLTA
jgi:amino acid permease